MQTTIVRKHHACVNFRHERAAKLQEKLCGRIRDIVASAISFRYTRTQMFDMAQSVVLNTCELNLAPVEVYAEVRRLWSELLRDVDKNRVMWLVSIDGKLMTSEEVGVLTQAERKMVSLPVGYRNPNDRIDHSKGAFVWLDGRGKPMRDKLYW